MVTYHNSPHGRPVVIVKPDHNVGTMAAISLVIDLAIHQGYVEGQPMAGDLQDHNDIKYDSQLWIQAAQNGCKDDKWTYVVQDVQLFSKPADLVKCPGRISVNHIKYLT